MPGHNLVAERRTPADCGGRHLTASSCSAALDSCPEFIVHKPSVDRPALPGFGIVGSILITMYE